MQKEFLTSSEERNAARLKKLQEENEEYEKLINENEALRANLIKIEQNYQVLVLLALHLKL
jgi:hypothetical protein